MAPMYETVFTWSEPASSVIVTGTFDNWSKSLHLTKSDSGFAAKVPIPYGEKTDYKFIVDGRWTVKNDSPTEWDHSGNVNNFINAPSAPPPSVLAVNTLAEPAAATAPEPVTPVNQSTNATTAAVTPMAVPESSIVPYPGLLLDSSTARSIVESIVEVVSPSTKAIPVLATTQEKLNEPASTVKDLAIATTPSSTMAAVEETLGPLYAAAQEKAAPVVSAINGSIAPMFQRPHTTEHLPADHDEKMAEPGYPIKDLSSLTGPAPVVASAQATVAPAIASVTDRVAPMVASAEEALGPAVHAAQEKLAPVIAALQNAANVAVAMVTETPTAVVSTKDTLAAPVEDSTIASSNGALVHGSEVSATAKPDENPIADAALKPEPLVVDTVPVASTAPVDISASPIEHPVNGLKSPATPPPAPAPAEAASTPVAPASVPIPETPQPVANNEKQLGSSPTTPTASAFSTTTGSTTTTPVKPIGTKRHSSLTSKIFPGRAGSPKSSGDGGSGSDTESSPLGSMRRNGSARKKKTSIFGKIKAAFTQEHHPHTDALGATK